MLNMTDAYGWGCPAARNFGMEQHKRLFNKADGYTGSAVSVLLKTQ